MKRYKFYFLTLALSAVFNFSFAQKMHTPAEIVKLLADSKVKYQIEPLDTPVECPNYTLNLLSNNFYRVKDGSQILIHKYEMNDAAKQLFDKAETYLKANNFDSALSFYQQALAADTSCYNIMTDIGQLYLLKRNYDAAIKWCQKAINKNYIDFMAHWLLANCYVATNDLKKAVDEITITRILNRNNLLIKKSMNAIFAKAKRDTTDWCFNPQMKIKQTADNKVSIASTAEWLGYAMTKALWAYEPGYKESMNAGGNQYSMAEEKESLGVLLLGLINSKKDYQQNPAFRILHNSVDNNFLDAYIFYEIVLPQMPVMVYQLPEESIQLIKNYVLTVRNPEN